ncbi:MAG: hypothetical protein NUV57_04580, partial [archaeon]|nr:hypothetical protein [archaeon]
LMRLRVERLLVAGLGEQYAEDVCVAGPNPAVPIIFPFFMETQGGASFTLAFASIDLIKI